MKKLILVIILVISLVIINNLVRSIVNLWQKQELVGMTAEELQKEKVRHQELQKQYAVVKQSDFLEKEARNKLFLVKPGEEVIILPQNTKEDEKEDTASVRRQKELIPAEAWLRLFAVQLAD